MPDERLIRAGDLADQVYFISSGSVEVSVGDRQITLEPGDFFGEVALISRGLQPPKPDRSRARTGSAWVSLLKRNAGGSQQ